MPMPSSSGGRHGGRTLPPPTQASFLVRPENRFFVPTWLGPDAARSRGQGWPLLHACHRSACDRGHSLTAASTASSSLSSGSDNGCYASAYRGGLIVATGAGAVGWP